ncbi:CMP-N-acetylneuraminate-beta-galactosamide-alpha-2, 3-sialyltransferase [Ursidibacter arcticus]|uniref:glycosyltransferase family 52 n=1 Tax=Ursidibacter arcticus TaxID=1524965 RepID=UPI0012FB381D|nr:glycosyltransferase family 52 [Ursidibacter arcticus]KAE9537166.1 CMP-N-acetylneuraminate-beta-galactosamide-alpha-2, 3-sialyltransferase [Ursidibacter arcticus]
MNLIICYTPLQVLIAEKIIELYPNERFYGVMLCSVKNKKFEYYAERLSLKCEQFFSMHQRTERFHLLKQIISLKCKFANLKFDKVFVASINDIQIQFILSSVRFNEFYTFDDGTANIAPSSVYYTPEPNTFIRRSINSLFRNKYSVEKLKALSKQHYTIYPDFPNIIENTTVIDLFNAQKSKDENLENEPITHILLGQPVYLEHDKNIRLAEKVIKDFNIELYLAHPREQYKLDDVSYIDTPLILEDYLAQEFSHRRCRIYTYFSSAVLNIKNPNIEVVALRIDTERPDFIECYKLLDKVGIKIIDIRE